MVYSLPDGKKICRFNARVEPIRDDPFPASIFAFELSPTAQNCPLVDRSKPLVVDTWAGQRAKGAAAINLLSRRLTAVALLRGPVA